MTKILDWLSKNPWLFQLVIFFIWIFFAIAAVGKGETYAVYVAFVGMLIWALTEDDKVAYQRLLDQSLNINRELLEIVKEQHDGDGERS